MWAGSGYHAAPLLCLFNRWSTNVSSQNQFFMRSLGISHAGSGPWTSSSSTLWHHDVIWTRGESMASQLFRVGAGRCSPWWSRGRQRLASQTHMRPFDDNNFWVNDLVWRGPPLSSTRHTCCLIDSSLPRSNFDPELQPPHNCACHDRTRMNRKAVKFSSDSNASSSRISARRHAGVPHSMCCSSV